jgi:hypothetical protein
MLRKLGCLLLVMGLGLPALAAAKPGVISGYVRRPDGVPQMGAVVEVLGSALHSLRVFTDENGFYSADGLLPGVYSLRVSAPTFLTQLREHVGVRSGSKVTVNLTLATLFDALQLVPARAGADDDDWKWVLRSSSNRPVLRLLDDGSVLLASENGRGRELKGTVAFLAGSSSDGYSGASDMNTAFSMEKSIFSSGTVSFQGNVGYGDTVAPTTVMRASYRHKLLNGSEPQVSFTMRRLPAPDLGMRDASLQALALNSSDNLVLGDVLEFTFGSELLNFAMLTRGPDSLKSAGAASNPFSALASGSEVA